VGRRGAHRYARPRQVLVPTSQLPRLAHPHRALRIDERHRLNRIRSRYISSISYRMDELLRRRQRVRFPVDLPRVRCCGRPTPQLVRPMERFSRIDIDQQLKINLSKYIYIYIFYLNLLSFQNSIRLEDLGSFPSSTSPRLPRRFVDLDLPESRYLKPSFIAIDRILTKLSYDIFLYSMVFRRPIRSLCSMVP